VGLVPLPVTDIARSQGLARARRSGDAIMDERRLRLFYLAGGSERAHQKRERAG
jgi:hypothetical protein